MTRKTLTAMFAVLVLATGCASATKAAGTAGRSSLPTSDPTSPSTPTKAPAAKYGHSCDLDLNSNYGQSPTGWLVGDAELHNTGNVGVMVRVKATWKQAGSRPITATKKTRLGYKKRHAVHFKIPVDQNQVDATQSAPGYLGGGGWCGVRATLVSTYGPAH